MRAILFIGLFYLSMSSAHSAPCHLSHEENGFAVKVIDGDTITLRSGQDVRLVGIQAPKLPLGRKNYPTWPLAHKSKKELEERVLNKAIRLKYGGRKTDRHGRKLAHIFVGSQWVQKEMIDAGMARVYSFTDNRACVEELLKVEHATRKQKTGIWDVPFFQIKKAQDIEQLTSLTNTFQLVRGKVLSIGEAKGKIYLNFGKKWKTDFTAIIPRHAKRYFKKSEFDLRSLQGKEVLIRGWLGFHNGPMIDLSHPEQIEIMKR